MDNKIKTFTIWAFTICSFILSGCTQNNWADWKVQNELWLANNLKQEGVQVTESGLQYKIIADPTPKDARPNTTSTIVCDYRVKLINGCIVESQGPTFGGTISAKLNLSQVIPGFVAMTIASTKAMNTTRPKEPVPKVHPVLFRPTRL